MGLKDTQTQIITFVPTPAGVVAPAALILDTLVTIDVSDPTAPFVASTLATVPAGGAPGVSAACEYIDTLNHIEYVISGQGGGLSKIQAVNISPRTAPIILDTQPCSKGDSEYRIAQSGNTLLCANSSTSDQPYDLQVFDITVSTAIVVLPPFNLDTSFATSQIEANEAIAVGTNLFVSSSNPAAGKGQLGVYDVSNPLVITQTVVVDIENTGIANDVLCFLFGIVGNYAFFIVKVNSLGPQVTVRSWDISNPALPIFGNSVIVPTVNTLRFSQPANGHAYGVTTSAADKNIYAVDLTVPLILANDGTTPTTGGSNFSIRAAGTKVYLACDGATVASQRELRIFDATVPGALVQQGLVVYNPLGGGSRQQLHLDV